MRVAVFSSTAFGYRCLKDGILPAQQVQLAGILTTPAKIDISYSKTPVSICTHVCFDELATQAGAELAVLDAKATPSACRQHLARWKPDLLLVLGWYYMVPMAIIQTARLGCAGIHASLLPRYRGGAPIPWAIINGETRTGITLFYFDDGVDTGDVIAQRNFPIEQDDTCATVYDKATQASIETLRELLPLMAKGAAPRRRQDESQATQFPQRSPEDGCIDWGCGAKRIYDFVRAQTRPYPGAFTSFRGEKVTVWQAKRTRQSSPGAPPGSIAGDIADAMGVWCGDGEMLAVQEVGLSDGREMTGAQFVAAHSIESGELFRDEANL